jgi:translation initiation factor 4G
MTSTASQQNQNPAQTPAAPAAAPSYASAAGANNKPTSTPLNATGSQPPVVVGSSASAAQNGKPSTAAPMNGRPNITPAVPVAAPPVARGSNVVNGGADHARKSSVTISANVPAGHMANGGPVGAHKNIQFGFNESPAIAHSTPQIGGAAPIPIPGTGNPRIQSPAHSPSPIPQIPQQSGGGQRAPSMPQAPLTFGSFPGDNDVSNPSSSPRHPLLLLITSPFSAT